MKHSTLWVVHAGAGALYGRVVVGGALVVIPGHFRVSLAGTELEALPFESCLHAEPEGDPWARKSALERVSEC